MSEEHYHEKEIEGYESISDFINDKKSKGFGNADNISDLLSQAYELGRKHFEEEHFMEIA